MKAQEISLEVRTAARRVSEELGFDQQDGSMIETAIHPMLRQAAYDAAADLSKKMFIKAHLFDKRSDADKEKEAASWLENLTLTRSQAEAIKAKLTSKEALKAVQRAVEAEYENGF